MRDLQMALCKTPSLQSLVLRGSALGSAGLAELAPSLYHNTSIEELDMSYNNLGGSESAEIIRDILCHNETMTALDLSFNSFGRTTGAVECIANGLGTNSTLLKIDLSHCVLQDDGISILAQTLGSRNTALQKLKLASNSITSTGVGVLLKAMEHTTNHPITDLDLPFNSIGNKGARSIARPLENNALPNLTRLSLSNCDIGDDGFITLVSALEHNTSLLQLDLRFEVDLTKRALATSLPEIKVLQRLDLRWCQSLGSATPSKTSWSRSQLQLGQNPGFPFTKFWQNSLVYFPLLPTIS
jgi:Ran GTPase-activating protein (RanGAP) involved in mRNA processing and transport